MSEQSSLLDTPQQGDAGAAILKLTYVAYGIKHTSHHLGVTKCWDFHHGLKYADVILIRLNKSPVILNTN